MMPAGCNGSLKSAIELKESNGEFIIHMFGADRLTALTLYATSCWLLNNVLQHHYFHECRGSLLSIFLSDNGWYCHFVDAALKALQWSPIIVAGPILLRNFEHSFSLTNLNANREEKKTPQRGGP